MFAKLSMHTIALFSDLEAATWDDKIVDTMNFLQHSVLQVPFFLMMLMKFLSPALDNMFMESLDWVDRTYMQKHASEDPSGLRALYYPTLKQWSHTKPAHQSEKKNKSPLDGLAVFLLRYGRKAGLSLAILGLSYIPFVGKFVLPALSFYYFRAAIGSTPLAIGVFATGLFLPRTFLVRFLQTFFSSRTLMRELLDPYFTRIPFTPSQKKRWFLDREGVLFGFGAGFFLLVKIPLVGVLVYGIAEASTAYLITKITDPPPFPPALASSKTVGERERQKEVERFVEGQVTWTNKKEFLRLPLERLDALNVVEKLTGEGKNTTGEELPQKKFS